MAQLERLQKSSDHDHDHEDHQKKSVLKKVKEKAKKLKHSLSGKKKYGMEMNEDNTSTSSGARGEDAPGDDDNPEFRGPPSNLSELAPETSKENSRQHPGENVVPGNHTLPGYLKTEVKQGKEKSITPNKTTSQSESEQLAPKIAGLKITNHNDQEPEPHSPEFEGLPILNPDDQETEDLTPKFKGLTTTNPIDQETEAHTHASEATTEGVSMKEYFMQKLEPGEDEKALSHIISDSFSPTKSSGQGVVGKVREVVSSFIWQEDKSQPTIKNGDQLSAITSDARKLQSMEDNFTTSQTSSSRNAVCNRSNPSPVPTSTNEEVEEQNHGRILQTN